MKIEEYKRLSKKENKYYNVRICSNGIFFDSRKEANRYKELFILEAQGYIKDLECQHKFVLQPGFKKNGKTIRAITYSADFVYYDLERMKIVVEDVKGFKTKEYMLKKKIFEYKFPDLTIVEI